MPYNMGADRPVGYVPEQSPAGLREPSASAQTVPRSRRKGKPGPRRNPRRGTHRRRLVSYGAPARFGTVVMLPARNEEAGILLALDSLAAQSEQPDLILVVVNNSTDSTEAYARAFAERPGVPQTLVFNLPNNPHKKAGALNHAFHWLHSQPGGLAATARFVMVMDADTSLHPEFLARARRVMESDRRLGGLSATCLGRTGLWSTAWQRYLLGMQIMEYGRYARGRYRSNIHSMSGAGSFYRSEALLALLRWRGEVFWQDYGNLVEDYETTLALKESGWKVTANEHCIAYTDLMPSLRELIGQRERWGRGTVDTLRRRGWTKHTWYSITTMVLGFMGFVYTMGWMAVWVWLMARDGVLMDPRWLALVGFWSTYAAVRARHMGWKGVLVDVLVLPGLVYSCIRNYWLITSLLKSYVQGEASWK